MSPQGSRIHVSGVVQGVGFRPFVYGLATRLALRGWVRNTSAGVDIEVDGTSDALGAFVLLLRHEAPPLAHIEDVHVEWRPPNGFQTFEIVHSQPVAEAFQPIASDSGICPECLRELFDPSDRRYRHPFINCTHCGPRFTLITDIPYDRPNTTMAAFAMCPDCAAEYADPLNRRFHAQPIACPQCGPQVWLETAGVDSEPAGRGEAAIQATRELLSAGRIVAIKGLGGFHLACDATNPGTLRELRRRKLRVDKPFALMMPDLAAVNECCFVSDGERVLLESRERPIVILRRRSTARIAPDTAPGQDTLGVMLPYTPLHYLLIERAPGFPTALVMTSGNVSDEPIATTNTEACERLATLADAFLMHDRDIYTRCDDSVMRVAEQDVYPLRRSRGYAPFPVRLPFEMPAVLATGAELKNTFCLTHERYAFLSHHIGDLENYETLRSFEDGVMHFEQLFRVRPAALAYDLHPDYLATRYALARAEREGLPAIGVQHHHAHIAACMAEHGLPGDRSVIGVALDGTGYGDDGAIWGGEFLLADYRGYERAFHLAYVPMPGGDAAVRHPWRLALAWLAQAGIEWSDDLPPVRAATPQALRVIRQLLGQPPNKAILSMPQTSSMGRLFDAVAALAGVRQTVNYEAQAAIELEALADGEETGSFDFALDDRLIDPLPVIRAIVADVRAGVPVARIAARFHRGVARMVLAVCQLMRRRAGIAEVALSGGVWQNVTLLKLSVELLRADGFTVYLHRTVPANDGGLALGQAAIAGYRMSQAAGPYAKRSN